MIERKSRSIINITSVNGLARLGENTGLLVALWLDSNAALVLALPNGERAENLHITLPYDGEVDDLSELEVIRTITSLERYLTWRLSLAGGVSGFGCFLASATSDEQDMFYTAPRSTCTGWTGSCEACPASSRRSSTPGPIPHITPACLNSDASSPVPPDTSPEPTGNASHASPAAG